MPRPPTAKLPNPASALLKAYRRQKYWKCRLCNASYDTLQELQDHVLAQHKEEFLKAQKAAEAKQLPWNPSRRYKDETK